MTFANAITADKNTATTRTTNGMKAHVTTNSKVLDLFGTVGSARGKDVSKLFWAAMGEDENLTLRLLQWLRDITDGAGERAQFRTLLTSLDNSHPDVAARLMHKIPLIGRWDDLFAYKSAANRKEALAMFASAINAGDGLAAKWAPREKSARKMEASELRKAMGLNPKQYRKKLAEATNVVETLMCSGDWSKINFSHVPSLASARLQKAFGKNAPDRYSAYLAELKKPQAERNPKVKINAKAVYPYDVIKSVNKGNAAVANEQWKALPNYVGDAKILPMVDVSGSMTWSKIGDNLTPMDVALSLGLYCSDKNTGDFKDVLLTFSAKPELFNIKGDLSSKISQLRGSDGWGMNTNLEAAFQAVLKMAIKNKVHEVDMPDSILILSDMQFDTACNHNNSALNMIKDRYAEAGYRMPNVVFWNLSNDNYGNTPVKVDDRGVVLVSGFNPNLMTTVLDGDFENYTPYNMMLKVLNKERYDI